MRPSAWGQKKPGDLWVTTGMQLRENGGEHQGARISGAVLPSPLLLPLEVGFLTVSS